MKKVILGPLVGSLGLRFNCFICHLPFLVDILAFSILHLGLTLMRVTASYSYEGLLVVAIDPYAADHDGVSAIGCKSRFCSSPNPYLIEDLIFFKCNLSPCARGPKKKTLKIQLRTGHVSFVATKLTEH